MTVDGRYLAHPPKADTLEKNYNVKFEKGSQAASATAIVTDEGAARVEAEGMARQAAIEKYEAEFHEPVDWDSATFLITHTTFNVTAYLNVEMS